ncbi:MAG: DNA cytosine methyltransferase [Alphaproteobacteria bacterium]
MRTVAFCEIDPFCHAVLHKHWPHVPIHADIRRLDGTRYRGTVDLVCGGYPCQPFSVAGSRRGAGDERHLWPEMYRLIREIRPRWVVAENVAGHIGFGFDEVAASLEAEGYTVWPFVIPASAVNAPHRRDRLWIIAHADGADAGTTGDRHPASLEGRASLQAEGQGRIGAPVLDSRLSALPKIVADAYSERLQGSNRQLQTDQGGENKLPALLPAFYSETFFSDELPAPVLCGKDDGIPYRAHRLRCLGNTIVPQIAAIIGRVIVDYEKRNE